MDNVISGLVDKLFTAGAHIGYAPKFRHPSSKKFIFGAKGGVELIDLTHTAKELQAAVAFLKTVAASRKPVLFVGGKAEAKQSIERVGERTGQPFVAGRFIGGTLTNFGEIKKRLARFTELSDMKESGEIAKFTKLERLRIDREIEDLSAMFGGLRGLAGLPGALVVIDPKRESIAVVEAAALNIPVVALMNTDCNSNAVTYPIPGNDASRHTIQLVLEELGRAIEEGMQTPAPDTSAVQQ